MRVRCPRRHVLVIVAALMSMAAFAQNRTSAPPQPRPNILLIVADDLGYADIGASPVMSLSRPQLGRCATLGAPESIPR